MPITPNIIANADDFGLNNSVSHAILYCFQNGYINSTSFITNTLYFEEAVNLIHENSSIKNIGVHINLAEGRPVTGDIRFPYIGEDGNWNTKKINKVFNPFSNEVRRAFEKEISAQIEKALASKISITHLDSHYHLHTLPCFYDLFIKAAKKYELELRLAQTYNEGNYMKFLYRKYINSLFKNGNHYSDYFETVDEFLKRKERHNGNKKIEVMLHPDFDSNGNLTDHYDEATMVKWLAFIKQN